MVRIRLREVHILFEDSCGQGTVGSGGLGLNDDDGAWHTRKRGAAEKNGSG